MQRRKLLDVDDPLLAFSSNLRRLREEKGLSQEALALSAGMDPAEVRRIELGSRDPGVRVIARLARGLGMRSESLFVGVE